MTNELSYSDVYDKLPGEAQPSPAQSHKSDYKYNLLCKTCAKSHKSNYNYYCA